MDIPPIVSAQEWEAARKRLLVTEKEVMRAHDALAAKLDRKNAWGVMVNDGSLTVSVGDWSETTELRKHEV